ncbi:MAG: Crp/Fnr family transcriptional regulator [Novosphingobium sp.]|nr:Crp/Fnr family transcriptional regulator [Novosphingobium sp.]
MVEGNGLLAALRPQELALLAPHLSAIDFDKESILFDAGEIVRFAYFPRWSAIAGFTVVVEDGQAVETLMVGMEGAIGGMVSQGYLPAYARCSVLHPGSFYRISLAELDRLKGQAIQLGHLFNRYADCVMAQVFQSVACNATHTIEERAAKWLCATVERTGMNYVDMTQEQIASMMGIGRSYASRVLQRLKADSLIKTRRGGIEILAPDRLRAHACSCNAMVSRHFETVLGGVYPDPS